MIVRVPAGRDWRRRADASISKRTRHPMSKRSVQGQWGLGGLLAALGALALVSSTAPPARSSGGPIDQPKSAEPRVAVARCLTPVGLVASKGNFIAFEKVV